MSSDILGSIILQDARDLSDKIHKYEDTNNKNVENYVSMMQGLETVHQVVRDVGAIADVSKAIRNFEQDNLWDWATTYANKAVISCGYSLESHLGNKNLGMKYLAPIHIASQV